MAARPPAVPDARRPTARRCAGLLSVVLAAPFWILAAVPAEADVAQILAATGDGAGNVLTDPRGVAVDASGNVYVAGYSSRNVFRIAPGGAITEIADAAGDGGGGALGFATGLAVDGTGNVYVSSETTHNVLRIATPGSCSTEGTPCAITEIVDASGDGTHALEWAAGLATDAAGNVYVAGVDSNNVFRIATPGGCSTAGTPCAITQILDDFEGGFDINNPVDVATDGAGNVYVAGLSLDNVVRVATPGTCSTDGTPCAVTQIATVNAPYAVATDGAGNVYAMGVLGVIRIATPGSCSTSGTPCAITEIIDATGDGSAPLSSPLDQSLDVDGAGNVYVAGWGSDNAFAIATPGSCSTSGTPCAIAEILDATGDGTHALDGPRGLAVRADGAVYVTGSASHNAFAIGASEPPGVPALPLHGWLALALLLAAGARARREVV